MNRSRGLFAVLLTLPLLAPVSAGSARPPSPAIRTARPGVVILGEQNGGNSGLEASGGLRPGDIVVSYRRLARRRNAARTGVVENLFDFAALQAEEGGRGGLRVRLLRAGRSIDARLGYEPWDISFGPVLGDSDRDRRIFATKALEDGDAQGAAEFFRALADELSPGDPAAATWLRLRAAEAYQQAGRTNEACEATTQAAREARRLSTIGRWSAELAVGLIFEEESRFEDARAMSEEASDGFHSAGWDLASSEAQSRLGSMADHQGDPDRAEKHHRLSLEIRERLAPGTVRLAATLSNLASVAVTRNDLDSAERLERRALAIEENVRPGGEGEADSLNNLGAILWYRGDLDAAEEFYRKSLAIRDRTVPGSFRVATSLNNLGGVAFSRGDLSAAEEFLGRSLAIRRKLGVGGLDLALALHNISGLSILRGDLVRAESLIREALELRERLAPDSPIVGQSYNHLAHLFELRGEWVEAGKWLKRDFEIAARLTPDSLELAMGFEGLGNVARALDDVDVAEENQLAAWNLRERIAPGTLDVATSLVALGLLAQDRGRPAAAAELLGASLVIRDAKAPGSLDVADSLAGLAEAARRLRRFGAAEAFALEELEIARRFAPGSSTAAAALHQVGLAVRAQGRREEAAVRFCEAVEAVESQKEKLGGSDETKAGFAAGYAAYFADAIDVALELGRTSEAFALLERSRARSFLSLLAERDLKLGSDLSPGLERERRRLDADYDRIEEELADREIAANAEQVAGLREQLGAVRTKKDELRNKIRAESPRLASLRYPETLGAEEIANALDSGTLLLSWSVGTERTLLFVLKHGLSKSDRVLEVFRLPIAEKRLRADVRRFRTLLSNEDSLQSDIVREAQRLGVEVFGDALPAILAADRLLVIPDGPLHALPFCALAIRPGPDAPIRWLVEEKPVVVAASGTVDAELRRRPPFPAASRDRLIAFGDPDYRGADETSGEPRRGDSLASLPATRDEVAALAALFADASIRVGHEATEEEAKRISGAYGVIHFACHGTADEQLPLNSALALSSPVVANSGENGFLQAWEVFDQLRFDADLVALSACETGLGKEVRGEGLVGLTRAFQYAGARTVLASLWGVADRSTARLMSSFYSARRAGVAKDEALRRAQLSLLRDASGKATHPFHWAAFELFGDWR